MTRRGSAARGAAWPAVLQLLSDGRTWSGEALGRACGVSRAAVWKAIDGLRARGVPIEALPGRGYRLSGGVELLDASLIRAGLPAGSAVDVEVELATGSTNQDLMGRQVERPVVRFAEVQTQGRGRQGRAWWSAFGRQLQFSVAWPFRALPAPAPGLSIAVGVELAEALSRVGATGLRLKWPNDLLGPAGEKLCGILVELQGQVLGPCQVVIGVGVNLHGGMRPDGADAALSGLDQVGLADLGRNGLAAALAQAVIVACETFGGEGLAGYQQRWPEWDALLQRAITVQLGKEVLRGEGAGLTPDGALRLAMADGSLRTLHAGEVHIGGGLAGL